MQIVTVIQARTGSSRLPNKILLPILGRPVLQLMLERVAKAATVGRVVVATTTHQADDPIITLCEKLNIDSFRGDETDLLDRHYQVGRQYGADVVVKIPSDCPLIDPAIIDRVIKRYLHSYQSGRPFDFVSNLHPPTYPDGNDVEVMPIENLELAWREATKPYEREHTTPFFWENGDRFHLENVIWESGLNYAMSHRWTLDYEADYLFIKAIYEALYPTHKNFGINDIVALQSTRPDITALNAAYAGVNWYRHHLDELHTISQHDTKRDPQKREES